jgi:hypothetical protein
MNPLAQAMRGTIQSMKEQNRDEVKVKVKAYCSPTHNPLQT